MREVVVFNDIAGIAACTLGVSLPILSICDCKVYPVPTAVFSSSTRVPGVVNVSLGDFLAKVDAHWATLDLRPTAVLVGCFADAAGAVNALPIVERFSKGGSLVMVDPVMGDDGFIWAAPEHREAMRRMVAAADIACPNFTEFCALLGENYSLLDTLSFADKGLFLHENAPLLGVNRLVVTGIRNGDKVCNYVYDNGEEAFFEHDFHHQGVCGTGDMFSNIVLAHLLQGRYLTDAVRFAGQWIADLMRELPAHPERGMYIGGDRLLAIRQSVLGKNN